jgi:phospho-N-acetylmuramoyl-pentapeptide-transferase
MGVIAFVLLGTLMIAFTSNAVNLTDGLDGLAGGTLLVACFAMMVLTWIASSQRAAYFLMVPWVPGSGELMVVSGAMAGACLGFLWFNVAPAQVFMGDTGSLAMGGLLATVAVCIRQEALLVLIGGVFYLEAVSVMAQVGWFKFTRMRFGEGRRLLRCAPVHHHFQMGGWKETQVVGRFYLLAITLAIAALVTLKLR